MCLSLPPQKCVTFKFWEMLKNASEVTLVPKRKKIFLKIFSFVQSFVDCKVSLADGSSPLPVVHDLNSIYHGWYCGAKMEKI